MGLNLPRSGLVQHQDSAGGSDNVLEAYTAAARR